MIVTLFKEKEPTPLEFIETSAFKTTEKERVSICKVALGSVNLSFTYLVEGKIILKTYNDRPEKFCNFYGDKLVLGKVVNKDLNQCHTLTKAQVSRGGRPTYVEYNPKYSVYKDGKIYWSCKKGRKPKHTTVRQKTSEMSIYRYSLDSETALVSAFYSNYYFYRGDLFRRIGDSGNPTIYNTDKVKVTGGERFNWNPKLIPMNHELKI